ncbi:unnamed protein product, partial [Scytosiphon promiscuus]
MPVLLLAWTMLPIWTGVIQMLTSLREFGEPGVDRYVCVVHGFLTFSRTLKSYGTALFSVQYFFRLAPHQKDVEPLMSVTVVHQNQLSRYHFSSEWAHHAGTRFCLEGECGGDVPGCLDAHASPPGLSVSKCPGQKRPFRHSPPLLSTKQNAVVPLLACRRKGHVPL